MTFDLPSNRQPFSVFSISVEKLSVSIECSRVFNGSALICVPYFHRLKLYKRA
uniref:Uncharacterized protein n=1 Tax=Helianthus annuus TaxID=4232 RepID=A0A251ULD2_HELAN